MQEEELGILKRMLSFTNALQVVAHRIRHLAIGGAALQVQKLDKSR